MNVIALKPGNNIDTKTLDMLRLTLDGKKGNGRFSFRNYFGSKDDTVLSPGKIWKSMHREDFDLGREKD